ncbi:helix-turn-helix domain-containing protein [Streptomyces sp. BHT-5-2]|uniref:helix-turn-helix domain-containing protein n=1 Tax=Streptomyces sp. BHT-5-2 TaxID=2866715 RepID=UPI0021B117E2|nr:helix-turn-helix transcriptional regulator [Streptomyces sp. BHT-5-2]
MVSTAAGAARAAADQLRAAMNKADCTPAQIAIEFRGQFGIRPRAAWRLAHGLTLQEVADRVNDLASTRPGVAVAADASLAARWEKWPSRTGRRPTPSVLVVLAEVFGCTAEELIDFKDRQAMPPGELQILRHGAPRRQAPQISAPPAYVAVPEPESDPVQAAAGESAVWAQWAESTNVGDIALEQLTADVRALGRDYLCRDPAIVFRDARQLRDRIFDLLRGHQPPKQSSELYVLAGYLCCLLAWMSSDLSPRLDYADTQGRTAWLCASLADHTELRAWTLSTRSKIAFWDGRFRDAIAFAREGAALRPSGTVGVLLACQEADAWSRLEAADEAHAALARAHEAQESLQGDDDVGGLLSCPNFRRVNYSTGVNLRTGRASEALQQATGALVGPSPHAYGTTAQMRITLACAHVVMGDSDGAAEALRPVLTLRPEQRLAPIAERMHEFAAAVARSPMAESSIASNLQSAVKSWHLESAPRRLALSPGTLTS